MDKYGRHVLAFAWLLIIAVISGYPGDQVPKVPVWQFDKFIHTAIYLILSLLLMHATQFQIRKSRFVLWIIVFFGIIFGGIMEILQHYIFINRSGNWYDFIANSIGAVLGVFCYPFIKKLLPISK